MSDESDELDRDDAEVVAKPKPPNPYAELIRNPAARTYLMISGSALIASCALTLLFAGSPVAAAILFILGVGTLVLRWSSGPALFVLAVVYLGFFPFFVPWASSLDRARIAQSHFNIAHLLYHACVILHVVSAFRLHAIVRQGMPFEAPKQFIKPGAKPTVRPAEPIADRELWWLFGRIGIVLLLGQLAWWVIASVAIDFTRPFPFVLYPPGGQARQDMERGSSGMMPAEFNRFVLFVLLFGGAAYAIHFALRHFGWMRWNRDEAAMVTLDTAWRTSRRDYGRPEAWRGWMQAKKEKRLPKPGCFGWFILIGLPVLLIVFWFFVVNVLSNAR